MTKPPRQTVMPARRPYLLRAMHQWMSDAGCTPHLMVDATQARVEVPTAYIKEGRIVLNVSYHATQRLDISNEWLQFDARFAGIIHHVRVPIAAVLGIYARETGDGMVFSGEDMGPPPPDKPTPGAGEEPVRRVQLKVVK